MNGFSVHWFVQLWQGIGLIDISQGLLNSLELGVIVMALTVVLSFMAGLAFRRRFRGSSALFYTAIGSLIMPSIVVSLGIALEFRIIDDSIKALGDDFDIGWIEDNYSTALGHVLLRARRPSVVDAAIRTSHHVRGLQSLQSRLRGGGARPRRLAVADHPLRRAADDRAFAGRRRAVRLYAVLGRTCSLEPGDGLHQHAADRSCRH